MSYADEDNEGVVVYNPLLSRSLSLSLSISLYLSLSLSWNTWYTSHMKDIDL
jgi:hypothetical protein